MKTGVIDMGTNTFHLLIAEQNESLSILHDEKIAVRLGKGGISKGVIAPDAIERAITTLSDFKQKLEQFEVNQIYATATSAVRNAKNQSEFIATVKDKTDLDIVVLGGEEEAFLIHQGVKQCIDFGSDTALIVDIGGGSIEFIIADSQEVKWLKSYEIGGQRLIDQFHKSDPITAQEVSALNHFLEETLAEVFTESKKRNARYLIGSSGSFDTFWDILQHKKNVDTSQRPEISLSAFNAIHDELLSKNREQRLAMPGMISMRADMIVGASVVIKNILTHCNFNCIKISPYALKEGVLVFGLPKRK